jgi:hypothetical protein
MMTSPRQDESQIYANRDRFNGTIDGCDESGNLVTQAQIRQARNILFGLESPITNPTLQELAAMLFVVEQQQDQIREEKAALEPSGNGGRLEQAPCCPRVTTLATQRVIASRTAQLSIRKMASRRPKPR